MEKEFRKEKFTVALLTLDKVGDHINVSYDIFYNKVNIGHATFASHKDGPISGRNIIEIKLDKEAFEFDTLHFVHPIIKRQGVSFTEDNIKQYIESILLDENNS